MGDIPEDEVTYSLLYIHVCQLHLQVDEWSGAVGLHVSTPLNRSVALDAWTFVPRVSDSTGLGWGQIIYISNK